VSLSHFDCAAASRQRASTDFPAEGTYLFDIQDDLTEAYNEILRKWGVGDADDLASLVEQTLEYSQAMANEVKAARQQFEEMGDDLKRIEALLVSMNDIQDRIDELTREMQRDTRGY
jgi:uncharacterized protein Yka (UPF0111/DUF47 family)